MSAQNGCVQFIDDEQSNLQWLAANPLGFVVNSNRAPVSSYLKLHRASCKQINNPNRTNWTTTGYIKTCSIEVGALAEWAMTCAGGDLDPCGICKPVLNLSRTLSTRNAGPSFARPAIAPERTG